MVTKRNESHRPDRADRTAAAAETSAGREFNLIDLEAKDVDELESIASSVGLPDDDIEGTSKHHLVFKILYLKRKLTSQGSDFIYL